jgi:chorismate mutase
MNVRAIRGAIQVEKNAISDIHAGVHELLDAMMVANGLVAADVISVIFTATPDLNADFPAAAAREIGFGAVPLICASEIDVPGALPGVIRVMMHCNTTAKADEISHIYLKGAVALRRDLAQ